MKNVLARNLDVLDDGFFDEALFAEWYNDLYECTENMLDHFKKVLGNIEGFYYQLNPIVLKEVVYDAIIGLRKIVQSKNNDVEEPNPFKIASHLGYWYIRHKPIMFCQWDKDFDLEQIVFKKDIQNDEELKLVTIWEIKHFNEVVAVAFMLRYIFLFGEKETICGDKECKKFKNTGKYYFNDFEELSDAVIDKLRYHVTYRCITPEVLEHFLEGYTMHPIWELTEKLWEAEERNEKK